MDPLLILIQLEELIQLRKKIMLRDSIIQFFFIQFLIDLWIQIVRMYIFPQICHGEVKD